MIYPAVAEVIRLHEWLVARSGGSSGVRDRGLIESAVSQPQAAFAGQELYPTLADKAAALGYSLARNHGFVDGNKRIAHAAMETFLVLNGYELVATVEEQETVMLRLAAGDLGREPFTEWVRQHAVRLPEGK
jgi:death-on-curing protein